MQRNAVSSLVIYSSSDRINKNKHYTDFALAILGPAWALNLYRQIPPPAPDSQFTCQDATLFRAAQLPSWISAYTLRIPIILMLSGVLLAPHLTFLQSPLALLSVALFRLCQGGFITLALYRFKPLHCFWGKRWIPDEVLLVAELILFIPRRVFTSSNSKSI